MKSKFLALVITATTILMTAYGQQNSLLLQLTALNENEFKTIEDMLPTAILREGSMRAKGQFNTIILQGNSNLVRQNTARYLAKKVSAEIYQVNLSLVKANSFLLTKSNLDFVFETVKNSTCILYFAEGEALFGKRTSVNSAGDRYDSLVTNYFLQKVEECKGSIIISLNSLQNNNPLIFERFVRFPL